MKLVLCWLRGCCKIWLKSEGRHWWTWCIIWWKHLELKWKMNSLLIFFWNMRNLMEDLENWAFQDLPLDKKSLAQYNKGRTGGEEHFILRVGTFFHGWRLFLRPIIFFIKSVVLLQSYLYCIGWETFYWEEGLEMLISLSLAWNF